MDTGLWNAGLVEFNQAFLKLLRMAMLDDPAAAAEAFGYVGHEEKLRTLTFLDDEQLMMLARNDILFGCNDLDELERQLEAASLPGPSERAIDLLDAGNGKRLSSWQAERRLFDLQWWFVLRGLTNENPQVASAVFRMPSPIVIHRIRMLTRKAVLRLASWGGNSRLRLSPAFLSYVQMLSGGLKQDHLRIAGGAILTSSRHINADALI
ncbi:hypothetical protein P2A98_11630 [Xanthomonas perforans]